MKIKKKLILAFGLLFSIIGGIIILNQVVANKAHSNYQKIRNEIEPAIQCLDKFVLVNQGLRSLTKEKLNKKEGLGSTLNNKIKSILEVEIPNLLIQLEEVSSTLEAQNNSIVGINQIFTEANSLTDETKQVLGLLENKKDYQNIQKLKKANRIYEFSVVRRTNQINRALYHAKKKYEEDSLRFNAELNESFHQISLLIFVFGLIGILVGLVIVTQTINSIIKPLNQLKESSHIIGLGNYNHQVLIQGKDEFAELGKSFNTMTDSLKESFEIIKQQKNEQENANYIKSSINTLYEVLEGDLTKQQIAKRSLEFLLDFYLAPIGAFYIVNEDKELSCQVAIEFNEIRKELPVLPIERGRLGTAVRNKKTAIIHEIPTEYKNIKTSFGEVSPECIIVYPIVFSGECIALVELVCLKEPSSYNMTLLTDIKESIGITLNTAEGVKNLKETYEKLEVSSQKLATKNKELEQFVYITSHDLQEPLRTITSYSQALEEDYSSELNEEAMTYIKFLQKASSRLRNQIHALLELSKIGRSEVKELIDFKEIFNSLQTELSFLIKEKKGVLLFPDNITGEVYGTSEEIQVLFQNLIINGYKYNESETPTVELSYKKTKTHIVFCVSDNGQGIEERFFSKIFEIFQRLENGEGSGIGLSHCKKIVDAHNGTIWVESEYGKGSKFFFELEL